MLWHVVAAVHAEGGAFTGFRMELAACSRVDAYDSGAMSPMFLYSSMAQVVSELQHVHALDVLHLDVKPELCWCTPCACLQPLYALACLLYVPLLTRSSFIF